jgi:hypothetical protein
MIKRELFTILVLLTMSCVFFAIRPLCMANELGQEIKKVKTFYITAPWLPSKVIIVSGEDRLDALTKAGITVWGEKEWKDSQEYLPKMEQIDYR